MSLFKTLKTKSSCITGAFLLYNILTNHIPESQVEVISVIKNVIHKVDKFVDTLYYINMTIENHLKKFQEIVSNTSTHNIQSRVLTKTLILPVDYYVEYFTNHREYGLRPAFTNSFIPLQGLATTAGDWFFVECAPRYITLNDVDGRYAIIAALQTKEHKLDWSFGYSSAYIQVRDYCPKVLKDVFSLSHVNIVYQVCWELWHTITYYDFLRRLTSERPDKYLSLWDLNTTLSQKLRADLNNHEDMKNYCCMFYGDYELPKSGYFTKRDFITDKTGIYLESGLPV